MQLRHHFANDIGFVEEERSVATFPGDALWTPEVDIYRITVVLYILGSGKKNIRVIRAELHNQRSVLLARREAVLPIVNVF